jgi:tetratricopeptide (TPR) repeat protein
MNLRKVLLFAGSSCAVLAGSAFPAEEHHHSGSHSAVTLGAVDFSAICAPRVRQSFNRAVALLHSFEYDAAQEEFAKVASQDPKCAMAHWGDAMTRFHGAWSEVDQEAGAKAAALARQVAAENPATSEREKRFIAAVSAIYSKADAPIADRADAFAAEMAKMHEADPGDDETTIFYALSLFDSAKPNTDFRNQRKCGELLEPLVEKLPRHPGVAHYLIHCYDNRALAQQGVHAAREYAKIAPDSAHATHMPSHIFVRLGLWQDTVQSNLASMRVAAQEPAPCHGRDSQLHAMHFLQFAYLQLGSQGDAKRIAEQALSLPAIEGCASGTYVAATYVLAAQDWQMARRFGAPAITDDLQDSELKLTAIGVAAARTGDLELAERAASLLGTVVEKGHEKIGGGPNGPFESARLEVQAWISQARGDGAKAIELIQRADDAGPYASWVQPLPAEHWGDLLMLQKQPAAALTAYRKALDNTPDLFNALAGAARAAEAAGDRDAATSYYRRLVEVAGNGDRDEIRVARAKLAP